MSPPEPAIPAAAHAELACYACGYALRGLDAGAICPECAFPIERSVHQGTFHGSAPAFVRRLKRGAAWAEGTVYVIVALVLFTCAGLLFFPELPVWPYAVGLLAAAISCGRGWWLLTSEDPALAGVRTGWRRLAARCSAVISAVLLAAVAAAVGGLTELATDELVGALVASFAAVAFVLLVEHARILAKRLGDKPLHARTRLLLIVAAGAAGIQVFATGWILAARTAGRIGMQMLDGLAAAGAGLVLFLTSFVLFGLYVDLVISLRFGLAAILRRIESNR